MSLSVIQRTNPNRIIFCLLHHLNEVHLQDSLGTQLALNLPQRLERPDALGTANAISGILVNPWFNPFRYVAFTQAVIFNSLI